MSNGVHRGVVLASLPLVACGEGADGVGLGLLGAAGAFIVLLLIVPSVMRHLSERDYERRMYDRRPWAPEDEAAPPRSRTRRMRETDDPA